MHYGTQSYQTRKERESMRLLPILLFGACLSPSAFAGDLNIVIEDVPDSQGTVRGAVYADEASFMKPAQAKTTFRAAAVKGEVHIAVHDLPAGHYAVTVYQDKNDNGKLDRNDQNFPTEPYGFSNDAQGGPPKFAQCAFDFDGKSKTFSITLNY